MFKCPVCGGKTKTCQTRHEDPKVVVRKCACPTCGKYFFTEETFKRWTEESVRQQIEERIAKEEMESAGKGAPGLHRLMSSFYENERKERSQVKIKLSGTRTDDADEVMARMVVTSAPIKWDEIDPNSFDASGSTFSGGQ